MIFNKPAESFKIVKGKKYYSKWSGLKTINTKKIPPKATPEPQVTEPQQEGSAKENPSYKVSRY